MITTKKITEELFESRLEIENKSTIDVFSKTTKDQKYKFLLESKDISHIYGRLSLIGIDPVLKITGKDNQFKIEGLNKRQGLYLKKLSKDDFKIADKFNYKDGIISGTIEKDLNIPDESQRSKAKNTSQIIRIILKKFEVKNKTRLGLYGAFTYDFIRLFEDIGENLPKTETPDFTLFLYDTFIYFDHLKERTEIISYRENKKLGEKAIKEIERKISNTQTKEREFKIQNVKFSLSDKEYEKLVEIARKSAKEGETFEIVFSNILKAKFSGDPFALYLKYRKTNPSPYLFFYDFGNEQLVGASPEMMVRVENKIAHLRPISGTAKRSKDPIEDHENMLKLLSNPKEKAELDMLIDLGRNDLSRVCKPGIEITDYRFVEKYSRVMHTVTHLSGKLQENITALDALIACLNAGTLTGAPKVAAMKAIEKYENERREYYGGCVGYLNFSGEMDTGIVIRTAHIKGEKLKMQVGATLLYDSDPIKEREETLHKAQGFIDTFANQ